MMAVNTPRFRWTCSYMGMVEWEVTDHTGTYRIEMLMECSAYRLSIANGDDVRQEQKSAVGILRRSHCIKTLDGGWSYELSPDVVDAFNEWRLDEHRRHVHQLTSQPERYGIFAPTDSIYNLPMHARGGRYVFGEHRWEITHAFV